MKLFGEKIGYLRRKRGLKQAEIAEKLNISAATWSDYERGKTEPNFSVLIEIAEFFQLPIGVLFEEPQLNDVGEGSEKQDKSTPKPTANTTSNRLEEPFIEYGKKPNVDLNKDLNALKDRLSNLEQNVDQIAENRYLKARIKDLEATLTDKVHSLQRLEHELKLCQQTKANLPHQ